MIDLSNTNTRKAYLKAINEFLSNSFFDLKSIKDMPPEVVSFKIDHYFTGRKNCKPATKLLKISAVRSFFERTLRIRLPHSEARKHLVKEIPKHSTKEDLTKGEVKEMIDYFKALYENAKPTKSHLRNLIIIYLLAYTGQRIGDILNLTVETAKNSILFIRQKKTGREVFIENPCPTLVLDYISINNLNDNDYIFANGLKRKPISYRQILSVIKKAGATRFGKNITPHCFRKFVITELRISGKTNAEVQSVTGHASSAMIDYYPTRQPRISGLKELLE